MPGLSKFFFAALLVASLVAPLRATAAPAGRCLTIEHRQQQRAGLKTPFLRPQFVESIVSAMGFPFVVHGPSGYTALLTQIRDAADIAWQAEIIDRQWQAPRPDQDGPDDRFDIYIDTTMGTDQAYVDFSDEYDATNWDDSSSFMVLTTHFSSDRALESTVSHELNHASQYAIDATEDDAFFEHTAVVVEQQVTGYPEVYGVGIADFQSHPQRALDYIMGDYYEYGAALWQMMLAEHVGDGDDALLQRLWLDGRQATSDWDNEPDFLDVLPAILADYGWDMPRFFGTFALWRYFTSERDDGAHFVDGALWGEESLIPADDVAAQEVVNLTGDLSAFGAKLTRVTLSGSEGIASLEVRRATTVAAMSALAASGAALGEPAIAKAGAPVEMSLPAGATSVLVALTCLPESYDPDDDDWAANEVGATLVLTAAPPPGEEEEASACGGCSATTTPLAAVALAAALACARWRLRHETGPRRRRSERE